MKKLYIIKTGTTFKNILNKLGDFDQWIIDTIANKNLDICVIDIQNNDNLPTPENCLGIIITGSAAMATDELPWSIQIEKWIPTIMKNEVPLLGICYGHQLLAKSMNGVVDYHPNGMEIGTTDITLNQHAKTDQLFHNLPNNFQVHTIHSQTVLTLPKNATLLASNKHDQHHAFKIGKNAWGVQFHPEYNTKVMSAYIEEISKTNNFSHTQLQTLIANVKNTNYSAKVLKNFATHILS
ncbi:glutamine amidotransferase [Sulfurospirillum arcachonense]|uniref:glutamine amidotransferase n=1 Tax=Sulfurospirillum arcachonense TaxID=57666 RepID=UPI000469646A|nr:glutamine amidotransferase [Sulfurospirillum arcachonense]